MITYAVGNCICIIQAVENKLHTVIVFQMIYMDCVGYFPDMLQEVTDIMTEKELRLRTPLEELKLLMANKEYIGKEVSEDGGTTDNVAMDTQSIPLPENMGQLQENTQPSFQTQEHVFSKDIEHDMMDVSNIPLPP